MSSQLLGVLMGSLTVVIIVGVAWYVLLVIACWRIFTKAGEPGWKSIIPIYDSYILYKISWAPGWFWVYLILVVISAVLSQFGSIVVLIIALIFTIAAAVVAFIDNYKLSQAFDHGVGFAIGLFILQPIFLLILGFGDSEYYGPQ